MMEPNQTDKYIGQMLDNRYEILELIGRGGMANVYKAQCHLLNRYVAIKILRNDMATDEEFRANFQKEAQAVAMLSHANIVSVYDVSRTPGLDYIVMELLEGITLKTYMMSKNVLPPKECVHFATQIARALSHAHSKGIVHRDIKPQNIMICMDGSVKVTDFGIAYLESTQAAERDTAVGSVHYVSPEQAKGQPVDARTDIYSLGVVMYEMLTGRLPYTGDSAESVALQHVSAAPERPCEINQDIPEALERITLKAMCADVEQRYQTADELLADLDEYRLSVTETLAPVSVESEELPENVRPISRTGELNQERFLRRHRRASKVSLLTGILLVIAFALLLFVWFWNYFLKDIFAPATRINIPNFVGSNIDDIRNNKEFQSIYDFEVTFTVDPEIPENVIMEQSPGANRSVMKGSERIPVKLKVSTGIKMLEVPSVLNKDYRDARQTLENSGFSVDYDFETSETVTENYVISTNPEPGDSIPAGATVYMNVSSGPYIVTLQMPNLVGLSRAVALSRIESAKLSLGTITLVESEMQAGTVIWQSVPAYTTVNEHTKVYLQVSSGPKETEPPQESDPPVTVPPDASPSPTTRPGTPTSGTNLG